MHPVPQGLPVHAAHFGRFRPRHPVIDRRKRQKTAHLRPIPGPTRRLPEHRRVLIPPQSYRHTIPHILRLATIKSHHLPKGNHLRVTLSDPWYYQRKQAIHAAEPEPTDDAKAPAPSDRADAERRQITVMFSDLVGSTELSTRFDPEDLQEVIRAYRDTCAEVIAHYDGYIAKFMGDGVQVYFGYPRAHEDDAERAVRAAVDISDAVGRLSLGGGERLAARVGIATGLVVVGELMGEGAAREHGVFGETPNLAARLQGIVEANGVVVGERTRQLLGDLFQYEDLGTHSLKGFAGPVQAWRVIGGHAPESRFDALRGAGLTPLVGRDEELALLMDRWQQARAGEGQAVVLTGEAGIGKSRIIQALEEQLTTELHIQLRYQCSPFHTNSALYPIVQHLERVARHHAEDSREVASGRTDVVWLLPSDQRYDLLKVTRELSKERKLAAPGQPPAGACPRAARCCWCSKTRTGPIRRPSCCWARPRLRSSMHRY